MDKDCLNAGDNPRDLLDQLDIGNNFYLYLATSLRNTYQHHRDVVNRTVASKGLDSDRNMLVSKWTFRFSFNELHHNSAKFESVKRLSNYEDAINAIFDIDDFGDLRQALRFIVIELFRIQKLVRGLNNEWLDVYASFLSDFKNMFNASDEVAEYGFEVITPNGEKFQFGQFQYEYIRYIQNLYAGIPGKTVSIEL